MTVFHLAFLVMALFLASTISAQASKTPEKWSYQEAYKILTDSPWAPAKSSIDVRFDYQTSYRSPYAGVPTQERTDQRRGEIVSKISPTGKTPLPTVPVLWFSSQTLRFAQQRVAQFRKVLSADARLEAPTLDHIVIVVEGAEPLRILRGVGEELRSSVFLELPDGRALEPVDIKFVEGERAGADYVAFSFPRELSGEQTVTPQTPSAVFSCKAAAQNAALGRPNSIALRVTFHPNQMRTNGAPDF